MLEALKLEVWAMNATVYATVNATVSATVSDKGQVTIPVALRERLGIKPGSRLAFTVDADGRLKVSVLAHGSAGLAGLLARPAERAHSLAEMDAAVTSQVRDRARRRP